MTDEPLNPGARLRRLQEEGEPYLPIHRLTDVSELVVRFPRLPGAPPALYGGVIRVRVYDDDQLLEDHLSPLETERGLLLDEHRETIERALAHHGATLRENLG